MSNKKGLIMGKVSIIDLLILLLIAGVVVVGFKFLGAKQVVSVAQATQVVTYTYEAKNVNEGFADQIEIGETVFNSSRNYPVGKVVAKEVVAFEEVTEDKVSGEFKLVKDPVRLNVLLTIEVNATSDAHNIYAGQENIKVGTQFPIKGQGFASNGFVVKIQEEDNE